jgi:ABC-type multidrug transport system fused ATPase/permease subunit
MTNPKKSETISVRNEGMDSEEKQRSLLSEIFVLWMSPLIKLANERTLTAADVTNVPESCSVTKNSQRIWQAWLEEKENSLNPSYFNALLTAYRQELLVSGGLQVLFMLSQLAQPILVGELVAFMNSADSAKDLSFGIGIAFGLGLVSLFSSMCISQALGANRILGANMRAGIMFNVYRFSLDLSFAARAKNSVGQTTNLISIDAEKFFLFIQFVHYLWQGPVTSFLVMLLLIQYVGYGPSLAGLAFVTLLIPVQNYIAGTIGIARRDMVKETDDRVSLINEVVQTIRVIKLYAWEASFEEKINKSRSRELKSLQKYLERNSLLREVLFYAGPLTVFFVVVTFVYGTGSKLEVAQTFRILAFINILRFPTNLLGQALKAYSDAVIAGSRLTNFFLLPVIESAHLPKSSGVFVCMENASFNWTGSIDTTDLAQTCTLSRINFTLKAKNELICIIGSVGSGKSSIMSTFLHEIPLLTGRCEVSGRIAFCSQRPWIQNMTLRDNVLFGADFTDPTVQSQYQQAIAAAELLRDIEFLPNGDSTEIGERGINLSGGQKARVSLARAFFASFKSDLILLDDPFSAVDGNTGNKIFENGVLKHLADKTRIVALNSHMHLLTRFDRVIVLSEGRILIEGPPAELYRNYKDLMTAATGISDPSLQPADVQEETVEDISVLMKSEGKTKQAEETKALIVAEKMQSGGVTADTYIRYFGAAFMPSVVGKPFYALENSKKGVYRGFVVGTVCSLVIFLVFSSSQLARLACDFYLAKWSRATDEHRESMFQGSYYIAICVLFVLLWIRSSSLNIPAVLSTKNLHESALRSVISAPITEFFDTHTIGEILNKFSKDSETVDVNIPEFMLQMLIGWLQVLSVFALCIWTIPWFVLVALPLGIGYYQIYRYFSTISRNLKRLESVSRSPVYSSLSETLTGIETIRAYGDIERFRSSHLKKMEQNHKLFYTFW